MVNKKNSNNDQQQQQRKYYRPQQEEQQEQQQQREMQQRLARLEHDDWQRIDDKYIVFPKYQPFDEADPDDPFRFYYIIDIWSGAVNELFMNTLDGYEDTNKNVSCDLCGSSPQCEHSQALIAVLKKKISILNREEALQEYGAGWEKGVFKVLSETSM